MGRAFEYRKATKMKRWSNMARTFTKIGKQIAIAVKAGGPDPDNNPALRACFANAKAANMPKENVERAIKKASGQEAADYKEITYEGYGPYGIAIVVEAATDNNTRTVANVRSYFTKHGGSLGTSGSLDFLFDRKCFFKITKPADLDIDELELELIDYGAEEVFAEEDEVIIYGTFESYGKIQKFLEEKGYEITTSEFVRLPLDTKEVTEEQRASIEKLIDKFEDDEDITNVFHNMKEA